MHGMFPNLIVVDKEEEFPKSFPIVWLLVRPKKLFCTWFIGSHVVNTCTVKMKVLSSSRFPLFHQMKMWK